MQTQAWLESFISLPGPSGFENRILDEISHILQPFFHRVERDTLQNHFFWRSCGQQQAPLVMIAVHIDEVGLYVHSIEPGGFLRVRAIGGVDPRIMLAQEWVVWPWQSHLEQSEHDGTETHAANLPPGLPAICGVKPPHLLNAADRERPIEIKDLFLDLGLPEKEVRDRLRVGDPITARSCTRNLLNGRLSGKSLDNRASAAVLCELCRLLWGESRGMSATMPADYDLVVVLTTQEELGLHGAQVAARRLQPQVAIVCDVGFGDMPGQDKEDSIRLGEGPALTFGPNIHPGVRARLEEAAQQADLPVQFELAAGSTGSDAWVIQNSGLGVATALLSIPLRYMHTPVETVDLADIHTSAHLLAAFLQSLDKEVLMTWNPATDSPLN